MLCVSLFIFTGFLHSVDSVQLGGNVQATELAFSDFGDRSDAPEVPSVDGSHCHGCAAAVISVSAQCLAVAVLPAKLDMARVDELLAIDRQFEPPPPKA